MDLSYWEYKTWLSNVDYTIVGSGITGLNCAFYLRKRFPKAKIVLLEKGILPQGASTKNAGFACFGSISEILSDLRHTSEAEVLNLVQKRWTGIQLLRKNLGDKAIDFQTHGGHELFLEKDARLFEKCFEKMEALNEFLRPVFKTPPFKKHPNIFHFKNIFGNYITNSFEGQLDTGKMMHHLLRLVLKSGTIILNSVMVEEYSDNNEMVEVKTDRFSFTSRKVCIAINGFASQLCEEAIRPARAQVLVTRPLKSLKIKGTFHFDEGYYYFRNVHDRILFGGGRNLDSESEETIKFGQTEKIQNQLEKLLKEVILPNTPFEIEHRWSGIMGIGDTKRPILKPISNNVACGIRLGGMGIAIGTLVGKELADLIG